MEEELTFYNYKEPLRPIEGGFGFYGAVRLTKDGEKLECHACGNLFADLSHHISSTHGTSVTDYKKKYELARSTSLVCEKIRLARKLVQMKVWADMTPEQKRARVEKIKQFIKPHQTKGRTPYPLTLETRNKRGNCPDQLLEKIRQAREIVGHEIGLDDFKQVHGDRYVGVIYKTFGSWSNAVRQAGYEPLREFKKEYTDEYLLQCLRDYYQLNGKSPSKSDCNRGLLPNARTYWRHFGGLVRARELAGIPQPTNMPGMWFGATPKI